MAQPQRHLADVACGFQGVHGAAVPQGMGEMRFVVIDGAFCRAVATWSANRCAKPMSAHGVGPGVKEQVLVSACGSDCEPLPENGSRLFPERQDTVAPPLPEHMHRVEMRLCQIPTHEPCQFRGLSPPA